MIAARVMRIMCAVTTKTIVSAGRKVLCRSSGRVMSRLRLAMAGNMSDFTARYRIRM